MKLKTKKDLASSICKATLSRPKKGSLLLAKDNCTRKVMFLGLEHTMFVKMWIEDLANQQAKGWSTKKKGLIMQDLVLTSLEDRNMNRTVKQEMNIESIRRKKET